MKTAKDRQQELNTLTTSDTGRDRIVALWKKYTNNDPGHWLPAEGWNFPALIRVIGVIRGLIISSSGWRKPAGTPGC